MVYTFLFFSSKCNLFIILTYLVPVLFTFYIQGVLKLKKNNFGAKKLNMVSLHTADPRNCDVQDVSLRSLACMDRNFAATRGKYVCIL